MTIDENVCKYFQDHLSYSDHEIEAFKNDPRWSKIIDR